jgi:hypothetical protein
MCPKCGTKSPVRLRPGQVCSNCEAALAWTDFTAGEKVIVITGEEESVVENSQLVEAAKPSRISWLIYLMLCFTLISTVGAIFLLYKFKDSSGLLPKQQIARFNSLSWWALLLSCLGLVMGLAAIISLRSKGLSRLSPFIATNLALVIFAFVTLDISFYYWRKTYSPKAVQQVDARAKDNIAQRVQSSSAIVYAFNKQANPYRPAVANGVVIANKEGKTWVLTVPFAAGEAWRDLPNTDALWVDFADGRSEKGSWLWFVRPPLNLAIIEVELADPPGTVEVHPLAEALIPGNEVFHLSNPLRTEWRLQTGTVLRRQSRRNAHGFYGLLATDIPAYPSDIGSGLYDKSGRLVGICIGRDGSGTKSVYEMLPSNIIDEIKAAARSGNLERLTKISSEANRQ